MNTTVNNANSHVAYFAAFIEKELGIVYSQANYYQLQNRLEDIVRALALKDIDELRNRAAGGITGQMRSLLLDSATNNETSFFRDPKVFRAIATQLLPAMLPAHSRGRKIRIWCAAASFGQEPYTLAMLAREHCRLNDVVADIEIIATDISSAALARCEKGRYSHLEVQRGLPPDLMERYFSKDGEHHYVVKPEIRSLVRFEKQNLLDSFDRLGSFDLLLCRNVLIYQSVANKTQIIKRLTARLAPGSHLILGAGESMIGLSDDYDLVRCDEVMIYRPKGKKAA